VGRGAVAGAAVSDGEVLTVDSRADRGGKILGEVGGRAVGLAVVADRVADVRKIYGKRTAAGGRVEIGIAGVIAAPPRSLILPLSEVGVPTTRKPRYEAFARVTPRIATGRLITGVGLE
jgi:hypothetical protein